MRQRIPIILTLLFCWGSLVMAGSIFPYTYTIETLPNGLKVIMIPMESPGLVSYYSVVRTGSRDEVEPGKTGFAHFFEHMMFRGTKKYPGPVRDSIVTSIGASGNAYTSDDITAYYYNFAAEDLERVIELEGDRFQNLHYEEGVFQTEAGAVYGEYRKNITSPFAVLNEKMKELAYDVHTYKHTTIGFEADIKAMPQQFEYSKSFFSRFYRPENVVLVIAGDIDVKKTLGMVKRFYSGWQKGYVAPKVAPEPPQKGERTLDVSYPGRTLPILVVAYKWEAFDAKNRLLAATMLLGELAFGENSDLNKKLFLKEQKVQFLSPSFPTNRDQGLFQIYSMVKKVEDVPYVRDEVYRTIEAFKTKPVDAQKLNDLKRRNKYNFLMGLDTPSRVTGSLARVVAVTGGVEAIDDLYTSFDAVTAQDIQNAAQQYFVPERRSVIVLKGAQ
ncbi:MAG: insulinase family protein [Ignavibacteriales bacterium]|nr:insulinase family protein [Ignavibacteriales bacterium]